MKKSIKKHWNILALRGDSPKDCDPNEVAYANFNHTNDLVHHINSYGGLCIGGACYPEGHVDCKINLDD